jgi:signal transduction histidine kinase
VEITLETGHDRVRLLFQDNGIGLAPGQAKKIFRKFYQEERPGRPQSGGSGLGLYLVEQIVRQHKGKVRAISRGPEQGTRFEVLLPRRRKKGSGKINEGNDGNRA